VNGIEWFFVGLPVGAALVLLERWLFERWRSSSQEAPGEDEEDQDVLGMVLRLQRSHKMLQGRVNAISPPRLGTGGDGEIEAAAPPAAPLATTRGQVLQAWKRGHR